MSRKPYMRKLSPTTWWLTQARYTNYMMREFSCALIGAYTTILVVGLMRLSQGADAWNGFLLALQAPASIVFHLIALFFSVYHTMSWFNVTPKAMPIQVGEDFLPGWVIVGAHYGGWIVVSLGVLFVAGA